MPFFPFSRRSSQHGGFIVGLIAGLLIGLALALGVALYVTKVPIPFINKVPQRTAEQDAAEAERNRNWDPNTPLHGKKPAGAASGAGTPTAPAASGPATGTARPAPDGRDPAAILGGGAGPARPGPDLSTTGASEAFVYFVQAGAYARTDEAEAQRAKLAIQGFESKITEREQSGRTMYRVRVGPFVQRAEAEKVKETLDGAGTVSALVRVQK